MPASPDQLIRPEILALNAYHVPPASGMVKLDAMENPYALPQALRDDIAQRVANTPLNRYPDPAGSELKTVLRQTMQVPVSAEILLGNGSDEIIQMIALALAKPGAALLAPEPGFAMYRLIAAFCGLRYIGVPLTANFELDLDAMLAAIAREQPAVVFIAYPNNPSGNLLDEQSLLALLAAAPGLVVMDEAYHAFAGSSFMHRLPQFPNLLVMRTLSKLGLAGLRLGFAAAAPAWIAQLDKLRLPYNVNVLTQGIAARVLQNPAVLDHQAGEIVRERANLLSALNEMSETKELEAFPSAANFILFRIKDAPQVFDQLKARGILIKNLHGSHPQLENCLRVTVGTPQENSVFLGALQSIISE